MSYDARDAIENGNILDLLDYHSLGVHYICSLTDKPNSPWYINYIANSVKKLLGRDASYYLDKSTSTLEEVIHPDDLKRVHHIHSTAIAFNDSWEVEYRIIHSDGTIRWIVENGKMTHDKSGNLRIVAYLYDSTERKEREIRKAQLDRISKEIIFGTDLKAVLQNVLEILLEVFNCDRAWLLTPLDPSSSEYTVKIMRTTEKFYLPEGMKVPMDDQTSDLMQKTLNAEAPIKFYASKAPFVPENLVKHFNIKSQLITSIKPKIGHNWMFGLHHCKDEKIWSDDEIIYFEEIANRITETLNSFLFSDELRKTKSYLSSIFNSMPSVLIGVDINHIVTHWNSEAEQYCDILRSKALGNVVEHLIPRLTSECASIQKAIHTRTEQCHYNSEYICDNEVTFENITVYPVIIAEQVAGVVIRIDDVTEEHTLARQVNQSRKMEAIGQLAGGVAHDFNNMLGGILGAAEMLKLDISDEDPDQIQFLDIIINSSSRAADLTRKLLTFSRKGQVVSVPVSVHDILADSVALLNRTIDKNSSISVTTNATDASIIGDHSAIQNSLMNLAINASHAMPDGGTISFLTENVHLNKLQCRQSNSPITPGDYIKVTVSDSGTGIPADVITKIFEPFFTTKERGKGTGLGLAAVYGTIQEHSGDIAVSSIVGVGTQFEIYLPLSKNIIEKAEKHSSMSPNCSGRILFVDDEEIIRTIGTTLLRKMGYTVTVCDNGTKALDLFKKSKEPFDLVISDMIMPDMGGSELFYKLKELDKNCKVLIASGYIKDHSLDELNANGLKGFIQKPFTFSKLSSSVLSSMNG